MVNGASQGDIKMKGMRLKVGYSFNFLGSTLINERNSTWEIKINITLATYACAMSILQRMWNRL